MKKYLCVIAAAAAILSLAGCSAAMSSPEGTNGAAGKFEGTDIGGHKDTLGDMLGGIFGDAMADMDAAGEAATAPGEMAEGVPGAADPSVSVDIPPQSGLLTGGEWNDNLHWQDWNALYRSRDDWALYKKAWRSVIDNRITVKVTADGKPLEGARVTCEGCTSAVTDNRGVAYIFYTAINGPTKPITVTCGNVTKTLDGVIGDAEIEADLSGAVSPVGKKLDLMIMCDTTGSMGDELEYLKVELEDIVKSIKAQNANIPTRVSVNFYRDTEDEYEVRQFPFSENIDEVVKAIREQSAMGGGDFPEAVHTALDSALNKHEWSGDSVKIMFLVLDAPPHEDAQTVDSVNKYVAKAAEMGVRIVPVASSGIDKSTEYLLRAMAFTTGGTYTFLTDDSGVGGGHIEPTVGAYNVEKLKDMMIRIVNGYLG